jgi:hypothetical protein
MSHTQPGPAATLPPPACSPDTLWQMALKDLRYRMTKATFNNWLEGNTVLMAPVLLPFWLWWCATCMPGNGLPPAFTKLSHVQWLA